MKGVVLALSWRWDKQNGSHIAKQWTSLLRIVEHRMPADEVAQIRHANRMAIRATIDAIIHTAIIDKLHNRITLHYTSRGVSSLKYA
jgi:hypothetical protein